MEDFGSTSVDARQIEIWISKQISDRKPTTYIADELLKIWQKGRLSVEAKYSVGRFCIGQGFFASVFRILKEDLKAGSSLPWGLTLETLLIFVPETKPLVDALLIGATRDKQLLRLGVQALTTPTKDPRFEKIRDEEFAELLKERHQQLSQLIQEIEVLKREDLIVDLELSVEKLAQRFPNQPELESLRTYIRDRKLDESVKNIKSKNDRRKGNRKTVEEIPEWPLLSKAVSEQGEKLNLDSAYNLTIGLHQMGFVDDALDLLRQKQTQWSIREALYEIELVLELKRFAEALELSQRVINSHRNNPDVVESALYTSAKAYRGLDDTETAVGILKALFQNSPDYRDVSILIKEWETS